MKFFLIALVTAAVSGCGNPKAECEKAGGEYKKVGSHIQTTYIYVGKVMVPQMYTVEDWECVK